MSAQTCATCRHWQPAGALPAKAGACGMITSAVDVGVYAAIVDGAGTLRTAAEFGCRHHAGVATRPVFLGDPGAVTVVPLKRGP